MFVIGLQNDKVYEYTLPTPFRVTNANFVDGTSVNSQESSPKGIAFSNDGTKMFVVGNGGKEVNEYTLSTPFYVSTLAHVDAFSVASQDQDPTDIAILKRRRQDVRGK